MVETQNIVFSFEVGIKTIVLVLATVVLVLENIEDEIE